jgi:hypothetical protein
VNKNSQEYLLNNRLSINNNFLLLCQENHCAFKLKVENPNLKEIIAGFREKENLGIEPFILSPREYFSYPLHALVSGFNYTIE